MRVLGVNCVYHESSAALVVDGRLVAAAEEERFNRRKHGREGRVDNPDELPWASIRYCLEAGGVAPDELDAVACSFDPELRRQEFRFDPNAMPGSWGSAAGEAVFLEHLDRIPDVVSRGLDVDLRDRFRWIPHHVAHAACAYYPSGFERSGMLVVDGIGEHATALLGYYDGGRLEVLRRFGYPDSLGFLWEKMSRYLGFTEYDACKVMGLAAYGDPAAQRNALDKLLALGPGTFSVDDGLLQARRLDFTGLEEVFGEPPRELDERARDIAAALQSATDDAMLSLARWLHQERPCDALCISGGVGLNCRANWVVKEEGPFEHVYLPSAPHDAGTALGAALHVEYESGHVDEWPTGEELGRRTSCLGPSFSDDEVTACLLEHGLTASRSADAASEAADLLASGAIVGWVQDRMEFGPRALGNRSLLADPRDAQTREVLNRKVKHREPYRPLAPSVLAERADEWLVLGRSSVSYAFMSFACPVRPERVAQVPAVVHEDGTARVQLVERDVNPRFHRLLSRFEERTGVPMVLNTSFNDSEPIVCSPRDAVRTFLGTQIDALVLGDHVVTRPC